MSYSRMPGTGAKLFNLGGGGKRSEYLMIGGLVLIIVAALTFTILRFTRGTGAPGGKPQAMRFQCDACKAEFEKAPDDPEIGLALEGMQTLDCPQCGARGSCYIMMQCPYEDCKKHYVSPATKFWATHPQGPPEGEAEPRNICPHCNRDVDEYWRQKAAERARQR